MYAQRLPNEILIVSVVYLRICDVNVHMILVWLKTFGSFKNIGLQTGGPCPPGVGSSRLMFLQQIEYVPVRTRHRPVRPRSNCQVCTPLTIYYYSDCLVYRLSFKILTDSITNLCQQFNALSFPHASSPKGILYSSVLLVPN